jgi:hypothetical protein
LKTLDSKLQKQIPSSRNIDKEQKNANLISSLQWLLNCHHILKKKKKDNENCKVKQCIKRKKTGKKGSKLNLDPSMP